MEPLNEDMQNDSSFSSDGNSSCRKGNANNSIPSGGDDHHDHDDEDPVPAEEHAEAETTLVVPVLAKNKKSYVLAVDVGTTMLRCNICDVKGNIKGTSSCKVETSRPSPRHSEIDEKKLWKDFVQIIQDTLKIASISSSEIYCFGLTAHRASFILWNRETGEPYHRIIGWQDARATELVAAWNKSLTLKSFRTAATFLHAITGKGRFQAIKTFNFKNMHVAIRLAYVLDNVPGLRKDVTEGRALFGTLDTWLLWKLTAGKEHVTEYSFASATAMFDPWTMDWSNSLCNMLNIPMSILPKICNTSGLIARIDPAIFGTAIPITAMIADQQSSMFAHGCYETGDVKVTLGTGTFLNVNTGARVHAGSEGLYPLVAWKTSSETVYCLEASANDTATLLEWARKMELFDNVNDTASIARSVTDSGGVYFVPAFSGLPSPVNNDTACTALLGITPDTTKAHILRALLESIVFVFEMVYEMALRETGIPFNQLRVDGGVANNDFVVQLMADLSNQTVYRPNITDQTIMGVTYLAGLGSGFWKSRKEVETMKRSGRMFSPGQTWNEYRHVVSQWERAIKRSMNWYKYSPSAQPAQD